MTRRFHRTKTRRLLEPRRACRAIAAGMSSDGSSPSLPPPSKPAPAAPSAPTGPAGRRPGRPWYLVVALLGAWFFGSNAALIGWQHLSLFRTGTEQVESPSDESVDDDRMQAQREKLDDAVYTARKRMLPLAAGSLLLGVALWIFAVGAMAGRPGCAGAPVPAGDGACGAGGALLPAHARRAEGRARRHARGARHGGAGGARRRAAGRAHGNRCSRSAARQPGRGRWCRSEATCSCTASCSSR